MTKAITVNEIVGKQLDRIKADMEKKSKTKESVPYSEVIKKILLDSNNWEY